jgi:hypothetical protein
MKIVLIGESKFHRRAQNKSPLGIERPAGTHLQELSFSNAGNFIRQNHFRQLLLFWPVLGVK